MKFFVISIIVSGFIAFFLFLLMRKNEINMVTEKWNNLIHSENKEQEVIAVDNLSEWIFNKYGSIRINAINSKGSKINVIQHKIEDVKDFKKIEMYVDWNGKEFIGKGWNPKDKNSIYLFLKNKNVRPLIEMRVIMKYFVIIIGIIEIVAFILLFILIKKNGTI